MRKSEKENHFFLVLNQSRAESELRTSNSFVKGFEQPQVYLQHKSFFHRLNWLEKSEISFTCIALKAVEAYKCLQNSDIIKIL